MATDRVADLLELEPGQLLDRLADAHAAERLGLEALVRLSVVSDHIAAVDPSLELEVYELATDMAGNTIPHLQTFPNASTQAMIVEAWNLAFTSGTALILGARRPRDQEQLRLWAAGCVLLAQAACSLNVQSVGDLGALFRRIATREDEGVAGSNPALLVNRSIPSATPQQDPIPTPAQPAESSTRVPGWYDVPGKGWRWWDGSRWAAYWSPGDIVKPIRPKGKKVAGCVGISLLVYLVGGLLLGLLLIALTASSMLDQGY